MHRSSSVNGFLILLVVAEFNEASLKYFLFVLFPSNVWQITLNPSHSSLKVASIIINKICSPFKQLTGKLANGSLANKDPSNHDC